MYLLCARVYTSEYIVRNKSVQCRAVINIVYTLRHIYTLISID